MSFDRSQEHTPEFVKALDNMLRAYAGQWPPRPSFENWPDSFASYREIADEMPEKLVTLNNAEDFRKWMENELNEKVSLSVVMSDLGDHLRHDDAVLLGFSAPLSFLVNAYRWGTIPTTDPERLRTSLAFPQSLWAPFEKINDFYGLVQRGNTFTLNVGNCVYDNDEPTDMRFCFNQDPEIVKTEKNFFLSFLHMEKTWKPALHMMAEYLTLTERARRSEKDAAQVLERRVQLMKDIRQTLVRVSRVFHTYMKDTMVSVKYWAEYVQALPAWNINGVDGGASGGESMTFHSLDEFLGTLGKGVIYEGGMNKRMGTPLLYRQCMEALADKSRDYRFNSFLDFPDGQDPLKKAHDDLISMLYTWRLFHTKVAPKYLSNSRMTSGGSVDKVIITGETLAQRGEIELRERARETAFFLSPEQRPKSIGHDLDHLDAEQILENASLTDIPKKLFQLVGTVTRKVLSLLWW